ncbi:uncharacterized protein LY89DRAFT_759939 [Mollisia scopiformis]|uniref:F-box domain-containing protein n=1 Tax=Mollisia scopiformis TaxID=149040 RepID=A0A194WSL9_MOLSC|nr:uncharacterized protein LY89DRAFT_759939 [Mollisia scopiformis]KUJ10955.1 hypothetical protein LY89DRAFT_759939 [Mollisia scopiformis]
MDLSVKTEMGTHKGFTFEKFKLDGSALKEAAIASPYAVCVVCISTVFDHDILKLQNLPIDDYLRTQSRSKAMFAMGSASKTNSSATINLNKITKTKAQTQVDDQQVEPKVIEYSNAVNATTLITLPTEIHFLIFQHLDRVSSVCLGLTCNTLYPVYRETWKNGVPLDEFFGPDEFGKYTPLPILIQGFFPGLVFSFRRWAFETVELSMGKFAEELEKRYHLPLRRRPVTG